MVLLKHMRFHYQEGVKIKRQKGKGVLIALPILGLIAGVYVLLTLLSPMMIAVPGSANQTRESLKAAPGVSDNRIYIPKINVSEPFFTGDETVMEKGVWHRKPERGNPEKGGNFILSAHRFSMGWTPMQTRQQSPFYNIDKLEIGDQMVVDYDGQRYGYQIVKKMRVKPTQVEIEASSEEAKLTLYSCTLSGAADGRDVVIAKQLGEFEKLH